MEKISAIVLIGGSPKPVLLKKCLDSLFWTDEIVKVDSEAIRGSFADWRNLGAKKAKGDWLFYVDSDEEVSKALRNEIADKTKLSKYAFYAIPRRNFIFGKEFKHGGQWPDYVIRLIKKNKFKAWEGKLHEQPIVDGEIGYLSEPLIHRKHSNIGEMVAKTNDWSEIEARLMFDAHHPRMNLVRFLSAGFREFWKRMIMQASFLDGKEGVIYAMYQVYSRLISYSKLWEMQLKGEK